MWLKKGSGKIYVNGKEMNQYFKDSPSTNCGNAVAETNSINNFDVKCNVKGGGLSGQAGAIIHGISRALVKTILQKKPWKNKFTTRSRKVERKKTVQKHVEMPISEDKSFISIKIKVI